MLAVRAVEYAELIGVVRVAAITLVSKPMVLNRGLGRAVITLDDGSGIGELLGHWLTLDCICQLLPLQLHIYSALFAHGAFIGGLHIEVVALFVEIVAARHRYHRT